jgi:hypothetical protein
LKSERRVLLCPECRADVPAGARSCSRCGTALGSSPVRLLLIVAAGLLLLAVVGVSMLLLVGDRMERDDRPKEPNRAECILEGGTPDTCE